MPSHSPPRRFSHSPPNQPLTSESASTQSAHLLYRFLKEIMAEEQPMEVKEDLPENFDLTLPELPEDVLLDILLRLPVESILRFECVSKTWYALFKSPSFIAKHLSIQSEDHLFITAYRFFGNSGMVRIFNTDNVNTYTDLNMLSHYLIDDNTDDGNEWGIFGHCDGIIVLGDYIGGDIVICNVATRNFRTLPKSYLYPFPPNTYCELNPFPVHADIGFIGFGYDNKVKDYKVLRVLAFWDNIYGEEELPPRAEIFSIGTDTHWREINVTNIKDFSTYRFETYVDGTLYGLINDSTLHGSRLLSFDMTSEAFGYLPLPENFNPEEDTLSIGIYNKKIALFVYPIVCDFKDFYNSIDVLVMKEYGMKQSWTKLLTIGPIYRMLSPLTFWKDDTKLFYTDCDEQVMSYDLVQMESKIMPIKGSGRCCYVTPYMKTLVSINGRV